jgi:peptide chain release factor 2
MERVTELRSRLDDLEVLRQLGEEEGDEDSLAEAEVEMVRVQKLVDALEVRTLLSGEYDQREALVSVRSVPGESTPPTSPRC